MNRREFVKRVAAASAVSRLGQSVGWARVAPPFDLVIRGGLLLDGTGAPPWESDVGIAGDRIEALGRIAADQGEQVIEANGLCVSPGFIDIHTHSDRGIFDYPRAESRVFQGITTEVTGNCGGSAAPVEPSRQPAAAEPDPPPVPSWGSVASYLDVLERFEISVNHALLIGQGTLRSQVAGLENRPLTEVELRDVLLRLEAALDQGAFGLSTGLEYSPGRFTPTEELIAMARVVSRYGGLYASHLRNEESRLLEALDEAIRIGRQSGVRVEISHLKAAGRANWAKQEGALDLIESARRSGIEVLADAYPYAAYSTGLSIFMPDWALEGGWTRLERRLENIGQHPQLIGEVEERVRQDPGDFDLIRISSVQSVRNRNILGKDLQAIALGRGERPAETLCRLLLEEKGSVGFIGFGMSHENVRRVVVHALVMIGSDGRSMAPEGPDAEGRPHPRSYGTCARVLGHFVRESQALSLQAAVRKMTSMPADQVGLRDRGRIARGMKADLVVFDAATVSDRATFEEPHQYPSGVRDVLVNGTLVVSGGNHTGSRPGSVLRRG